MSSFFDIPPEKILARELKATRDDLELMVKRHNALAEDRNRLASELTVARKDLKELREQLFQPMKAK